MGILDFIKGELIDLIEWTDDSRDTLSYRYPDEDKAIKNGGVLIVRESQVVQFMYLGQFGDTFGPGKHTLVTDNILFQKRIQGIGVIDAKSADDWGLSGPMLRASGLKWDLRRNDPYSIYDRFDFATPVFDTCDVWARFLVRRQEMLENLINDFI